MLWESKNIDFPKVVQGSKPNTLIFLRFFKGLIEKWIPNSGKKLQKHCKNRHFRASRSSAADPADPPETQHPVQNRPWVPHAGGQDYGSLRKLPQIKACDVAPK